MLTPLVEVGSLTTITAANPVPGAQFSMTLPKFRIIRPILLHFQIVTDANVANRFPGITVQDGAGLNYDIMATTAITASQTIQVTAAAGQGHIAAIIPNNYIFSLPPELYLYGDQVLVSKVENLQATDAITNIRLFCAVWPRTTSLT